MPPCTDRSSQNLVAGGKVVHLTSAHPVFDTRIFHKEAATLAAAGYEVVLIAVTERDTVERGVRVRALPPARSRWRRMTGTVFARLRTALAERAPGVVYIGDLTRVRGALEMVRAMALLPADSAARLEIGGRFNEPGLEDACRREPGWARVTFLGWQSRAEVAAAMARARVGLVLLHPVPHYSANYPVKLFEYMASGLPVVASDLPLCREVVESAGCGLLVDPRDPAAIARAIGWLLDHPAEAEAMGRRVVHERYSWASEGEALLGYYARLFAA